MLGVRVSHPTEEGNSTALPSRQWGLMGGFGSGALGSGALTGDKAPGSSQISVDILQASIEHTAGAQYVLVEGEQETFKTQWNLVTYSPGKIPQRWRPGTGWDTQNKASIFTWMPSAPQPAEAIPQAGGGACNPSQGCRAGGSGSILTAHADQPSTLEVGPLKDSH